MPPRWGLHGFCLGASYKHVAPPALGGLHAGAEELKRRAAETGSELDPLVPILDRIFTGGV